MLCDTPPNVTPVQQYRVNTNVLSKNYVRAPLVCTTCILGVVSRRPGSTPTSLIYTIYVCIVSLNIAAVCPRAQSSIARDLGSFVQCTDMLVHMSWVRGVMSVYICVNTTFTYEHISPMYWIDRCMNHIFPKEIKWVMSSLTVSQT